MLTGFNGSVLVLQMAVMLMVKMEAPMPLLQVSEHLVWCWQLQHGQQHQHWTPFVCLSRSTLHPFPTCSVFWEAEPYGLLQYCAGACKSWLCALPNSMLGDHRGNIYTLEIGEHYKQAYTHLPQRLLLNIYLPAHRWGCVNISIGSLAPWLVVRFGLWEPLKGWKGRKKMWSEYSFFWLHP